MPAQEAKLQLQLDADPEADAEELDQLTAGLRRQLLELDVESVDRPRAPSPPPGARAAEAAELGTLLVTLATTPALFSAVVKAVRAWLARGRARRVTVKLGDDTLELTGVSSEQQERLIADWIARHAES